MNKSSLGMNENVAGMLCYLLGLLGGLIFFFGEKDSKFVKFHAAQSLVANGSIFVIMIAYIFLPFNIPMFSSLINLLSLAIWIVGVIKANKMEMFKFPVIGDVAENLLNK